MARFSMLVLWSWHLHTALLSGCLEKCQEVGDLAILTSALGRKSNSNCKTHFVLSGNSRSKEEFGLVGKCLR